MTDQTRPTAGLFFFGCGRHGRAMDHIALTPELLLNAYANGVFPMAESAQDEEVFWVDPQYRGVLPLDGFHISRSLRRAILRAPFEVSLDTDFAGVVTGCAARETTWINATIFDLYTQLHARGFAHSIEVRAEGRLVGGVYGVTLGTAFFGESMFSTATNASKIALAYLTKHLARQGFTLFDTQFITSHLASLGAYEIPRADYHDRLENALDGEADFGAQHPLPSPQEVVQDRGQMS